MNEFYEWLYDSFARPRIREEAFPPDYQEMEAEWLASIESLSIKEDLMEYIISPAAQ